MEMQYNKQTIYIKAIVSMVLFGRRFHNHKHDIKVAVFDRKFKAFATVVLLWQAMHFLAR